MSLRLRQQGGLLVSENILQLKGCIFSAKHIFHPCQVSFTGASTQQRGQCREHVWHHPLWWWSMVGVFISSGLTLMNVGLFTLVFIIFLLDSVKCYTLSHHSHTHTHAHTHTDNKDWGVEERKIKWWQTEEEYMLREHVGQEHMLLCRAHIHPALYPLACQTCFNNAI